MIDVTDPEFIKQVRNRGYFKNSLVKSGIVQIVEKSPSSGCRLHRSQEWGIDSFLKQLGVHPTTTCPCGIATIDCDYHKPIGNPTKSINLETAANRIGDYFSRQTFIALLSCIVGVIEAGKLFQDTLEESDHPIALMPTRNFSHFKKEHTISYHTCPFTLERVSSYDGKRLVMDDVCLNPLLFYPGEVQMYFTAPDEEVRISSIDPNIFRVNREFSVCIKGFDYIGPAHPLNSDLENPKSWKRTTEKSRIVRVG